MPDLTGKCAVVTGASQGIGRAIAAALYNAGARLAILGRNPAKLQSALRGLPSFTEAPPLLIKADLNDTDSLAYAAEQIELAMPAVNILVNCGGAYWRAQWHEATPDAFGELMATNVIGPYTLTRLLLPKLAASKGDVVFVNSSITRSPGSGASHYKATQHALQSMSDSLRAEVNDVGVRVLSVFPGRTATPRQERIYADEDKDYLPNSLLQPSEIADSVLFCLNLPASAEITDLYIRPRTKS